MEDEIVLPESVIPDAGASEPADNTAAAAEPTDEGAEDAAQEAKAKPEKTPEQRELARAQRRIDSLTRQKYELRAQLQQQPAQAAQQQSSDDDEPITLTRAEMQRQVEERAARLAPSMAQQTDEVKRRGDIVASLEKDWGAEKFSNLASDLDDAFSGLADRSGKPKPATDAIFEADNPKAVIEYLTDPDNADEAERISTLSAVQAGKAIAKLEMKLEAEKSKGKPKPSNAPKPLEAVKGGGVPNGMPDPSDTKAYIKWANEREKR